jgi:hypothetical protein
MLQEDEIPSHRDLYLLVQDLTSKYDKLQKDYSILSKYVYENKGRISIEDILRTCEKPELDYINWLENMVLTRTHLEYVFNSGYVNGITYILEDLCQTTNGEIIPIQVFKDKDKAFFIYNDGKWLKDDINTLIRKIAKNILTLFSDWQKENASKMQEDHFSSLYIENLNKVIGGKTSIEIQNKKIENKFYRGL